MASVDELAKKVLAEKQDPFAKLSRDLPKGGNAMKVAEPLEALPQAMKRAAPGMAKGIAADVGVGMLIPESTQSDESDVGDTRGMERAEREAVDPATLPLKGHPDMIEKGSETVYMDPKDQALKKNFEDYGKKHLGPEFSVSDLGVDDESGDVPEHYNLHMESNSPLTEAEKMKIAGIHAQMRKQPGMKKGAKGEITLPEKFKSNTTTLEGDE